MSLIEFKNWFDELERAAYHEAGHAVAMKAKSPGWLLRAELVADGNQWGGGAIPRRNFTVPPPDVACLIGVSGCLAEARIASKGHHLNCNEMDQLAQQILANKQPVFLAKVPIAGQSQPCPRCDDPKPHQCANCTSDDFRFIEVAPDFTLVHTALKDSCAFLEDGANWQLVIDAAKTLSDPPHILT